MCVQNQAQAWDLSLQISADPDLYVMISLCVLRLYPLVELVQPQVRSTAACLLLWRHYNDA